MTDEKKLHEDNVTVVRVWTSRRLGGQNIGHVSIKTPNENMSLWPEDTKAAANPMNTVQADDRDDIQDFIDEHRGAEYVFYFYSLKNDVIEKIYNKIKDKINYTVSGRNTITESIAGSCNSCSGLAYDLLLAGGIRNLISEWFFTPKFFLTNMFVTTPDNMLRLCWQAKRNELAKYPETKAFDNNNVEKHEDELKEAKRKIYAKGGGIVTLDEKIVNVSDIEGRTFEETSQARYLSNLFAAPVFGAMHYKFLQSYRPDKMLYDLVKNFGLSSMANLIVGVVAIALPIWLAYGYVVRRGKYWNDCCDNKGVVSDELTMRLIK